VMSSSVDLCPKLCDEERRWDAFWAGGLTHMDARVESNISCQITLLVLLYEHFSYTKYQSCIMLEDQGLDCLHEMA